MDIKEEVLADGIDDGGDQRQSRRHESCHLYLLQINPKTKMDDEQESALKEINLDQIRYIKQERYTEVYIKKVEHSSRSEAEIGDNDGDQDLSQRVHVNQFNFNKSSFQVKLKGDQVNSAEGYTLVTVLPATGMPKGDTGLLAATQARIRDAVLIESGQDRGSVDDKSCEEDSETDSDGQINEESSQPNIDEELTADTERERNICQDDELFKEDLPISRQSETHLHKPLEQQICGDEPLEDIGGESGDGDVHDGNNESCDCNMTKYSRSVCSYGRKPYECSHCTERFAKNTDLKIHGRTHTQATHKLTEQPKDKATHSGETYECQHCTMALPTKSQLRRHLTRKTVKSSYPCSQCSSTFPSRCTLTIHSRTRHRTHVEQNQTIYECSLCSKRFPSQKRKDEHLKLHQKQHEIEKPRQCYFCSKWFPNKGQLTEHVTIHAGEKPHCCPHCSMKFFYKALLDLHMVKQHTGVDRLECSLCKEKFEKLNAKQRHMQDYHGENSFECSHCSKQFSNISLLNEHMQIHSGLNKYLCSHCGIRHFSQCALTIHMRRHIAENFLAKK